MTSSKPNCLLQAPSPDSIPLGVLELQHIKAGHRYSVHQNAFMIITVALSSIFPTGKGLCFDHALRTKSFTYNFIHQRITRTFQLSRRPVSGSVHFKPWFPLNPHASAGSLYGTHSPPHVPPCTHGAVGGGGWELPPCWDGQQ